MKNRFAALLLALAALPLIARAEDAAVDTQLKVMIDTIAPLLSQEDAFRSERDTYFCLVLLEDEKESGNKTPSAEEMNRKRLSETLAALPISFQVIDEKGIQGKALNVTLKSPIGRVTAGTCAKNPTIANLNKMRGLNVGLAAYRRERLAKSIAKLDVLSYNAALVHLLNDYAYPETVYPENPSLVRQAAMDLLASIKPMVTTDLDDYKRYDEHGFWGSKQTWADTLYFSSVGVAMYATYKGYKNFDRVKAFFGRIKNSGNLKKAVAQAQQDLGLVEAEEKFLRSLMDDVLAANKKSGNSERLSSEASELLSKRLSETPASLRQLHVVGQLRELETRLSARALSEAEKQRFADLFPSLKHLDNDLKREILDNPNTQKNVQEFLRQSAKLKKDGLKVSNEQLMALLREDIQEARERGAISFKRLLDAHLKSDLPARREQLKILVEQSLVSRKAATVEQAAEGSSLAKKRGILRRMWESQIASSLKVGLPVGFAISTYRNYWSVPKDFSQRRLDPLAALAATRMRQLDAMAYDLDMLQVCLQSLTDHRRDLGNLQTALEIQGCLNSGKEGTPFAPTRDVYEAQVFALRVEQLLFDNILSIGDYNKDVENVSALADQRARAQNNAFLLSTLKILLGKLRQAYSGDSAESALIYLLGNQESMRQELSEAKENLESFKEVLLILMEQEKSAPSDQELKAKIAEIKAKILEQQTRIEKIEAELKKPAPARTPPPKAPAPPATK